MLKEIGDISFVSLISSSNFVYTIFIFDILILRLYIEEYWRYSDSDS